MMESNPDVIPNASDVRRVNSREKARRKAEQKKLEEKPNA
jgi:hypothetical protein